MNRFFFGFALLFMIALSIWASLDQNVGGGFVYLLQNRWGVATLCDTYILFFTVYAWIFYKETSWAKRGMWFVLGVTLGSIATSFYILLQFWQAPRGSKLESILLRRK